MPKPYTAAAARSMRMAPKKLKGMCAPGKERNVRRRRMQDVQKIKYERWLQLDSKYNKKGPKKPSQHHTVNMPRTVGWKTKGKAEPLRI